MTNLNIIKIEKLLIKIRKQEVLVDRDVAHLYGVETKRINAVVKNNIEKFPQDYMFELNYKENQLVVNNDRFKSIKHSNVNPKVFTEKGLYMLATLLRSKKANEVTFQIIETFAKIRELNKNINYKLLALPIPALKDGVLRKVSRRNL